MFAVASLLTLLFGTSGLLLVPDPDRAPHPLQSVGMRIAAGMLANTLLVQLGLPLRLVIGATAAAGVGGGIRALRAAGAAALLAVVRRHWASIGVLLVIVLSFTAEAVHTPLTFWDARSIWFFHARAIWVDGRLSAAGWDDRSVIFFHPTYPNLVPGLAAQLGAIRGAWNEYFPKLAIIVSLTPAAAWSVSLLRPKASAWFLVGVLWLWFPQEWLTAGIMDAQVAIYAGLALLFAGRWLDTAEAVDLDSALLSAGLALGMKSEGAIWFGCAVVATSVVLGRSLPHAVRALLRRVAASPRVLGLFVLALAPTLTWRVRVAMLGLTDEMTRSLGATWSRLLSRAADHETIRTVFNCLVRDDSDLWLLFPLALAALVVLSAHIRRVPRAAALALLTAFGYALALGLVFVSTPNDLAWHLSTAGGRTMELTRVALFVSLFFSLDQLERAPHADHPEPA